jgi:hypothetical protein
MLANVAKVMNYRVSIRVPGTPVHQVQQVVYEVVI